MTDGPQPTGGPASGGDTARRVLILGTTNPPTPTALANTRIATRHQVDTEEPNGHRRPDRHGRWSRLFEDGSLIPCLLVGRMSTYLGSGDSIN